MGGITFSSIPGTTLYHYGVVAFHIMQELEVGRRVYLFLSLHFSMAAVVQGVRARQRIWTNELVSRGTCFDVCCSFSLWPWGTVMSVMHNELSTQYENEISHNTTLPRSHLLTLYRSKHTPAVFFSAFVHTAIRNQLTCPALHPIIRCQ